MRCSNCQHDNPADFRFCMRCGTKLEHVCPACGASLPPDSLFCGKCGTRLPADSTTPPVSSSPAEPHRTLAAYTPPHLKEKILTSRSALEGERKQVTVLFADLKGSLELLADRDPEEARQLLDPVLTRMMEAVHHYEGTVNQVMGDGIMALFGAPLAHEDHTVRACYAALKMQELVKQYATEVQRTEGIPIQIRVGLNAGEVVVRSIGSDLHMDYTAVGQTVHLAARMEQMAMPASILLTADALRLAEGYVQVEPLGPVRVRGLLEPVDAFELIGAGPVRTRLQVSVARGLTRFVGRQHELEMLRQALERARVGHGQIVALVGEPGVGKSRLFYEFTRSHRTQGWLLLETSSISYGKATSYLPLIDLLQGYFQVETGDPERRIREKIAGKLLMLDETLMPMLPAFLALLDVPFDDAQWHDLDPPQRRQQTLEAVKRLLLRESQIQPLLLLLEDLHWIDAGTQAFLDSLIESLPTAPLLLLVNYRPEYQHSWGSKTYYTQLRLDPLPPESAEELLHALLGNSRGGVTPPLQDLKRLLIERTEGNPFFLEENVRTLVELGALVGERGTYGLVKDLTTIQMPPTVQAVLAARIDRLPPDEKRLLQTAAVIGKDVPFALLQAIAELPEDMLRLGLTHLQAAEFLYETSLFPELEYTFKHALTHEVAYGTLLQERRRALHACIVEVIEQRDAARVAEQVEQLAHHALRGEVWEKVLLYCRQAGAKAVARSANREAVAYFEQALGALTHLPDSREMREQAIDLRFDLRTALNPFGEIGQISGYLREAERLAEALGDQRRLGQALIYMTIGFWQMGDQERALETGQRMLLLANDLDDFSLQIMANYSLGRVHSALGNYHQAVELFRKNMPLLKGDLSRERFGLTGLASVSSSAFLSEPLAELGEFAEGITYGEEAIRIAEAVDHPFSRVAAYWGIGHLYLYKGDLLKAISLLERGLELCQTLNMPLMFPIVASALGAASALSGRSAEALPLLEQAFEQAISATHGVHLPRWTVRLGEAYLFAGRIEEAMLEARRALPLARDSKQRGLEAWALRLLGEIASHQVPPAADPAEAHYRQAIAIANELGMRPLLAHCHLGLGTLYAKNERWEEARAELSDAIELYRAMEMTFWLPRAEAALAEIDGH
ncbi:MAG: AAA family ATPase [Nitrospinae bacterium]|nr:AAA family ATPase [Nitrospinota bacterium]